MSFSNSQCPCGGRKPPGTMLCDQCEAHLKDHPEMARFKDPSYPVIGRRNAAIVLLGYARRRGSLPVRLTKPEVVP